jgi:hypothetical protein
MLNKKQIAIPPDISQSVAFPARATPRRGAALCLRLPVIGGDEASAAFDAKDHLMQLLRGRSKGIFVALFKTWKVGPELFEICSMGSRSAASFAAAVFLELRQAKKAPTIASNNQNPIH